MAGTRAVVCGAKRNRARTLFSQQLAAEGLCRAQHLKARSFKTLSTCTEAEELRERSGWRAESRQSPLETWNEQKAR